MGRLEDSTMEDVTTFRYKQKLLDREAAAVLSCGAQQAASILS